jgi:hypothetical protein
VNKIYFVPFFACYDLTFSFHSLYILNVVLYFPGYGVTSDGHTTYINASTCTLRYKPDHEPIVFDFPIPEGHVKDELLKITPQRLIRS